MPKEIRGRSLERTVGRQIPDEKFKSYIPLRDLICRSQSVPPPERASYNDVYAPFTTGLPKELKKAAEDLFPSLSLGGVHVHWNSEKPAKLEKPASAYTEGKDIYVARGKEDRISHEIGHIIQKMHRRITPTKKVEINGNIKEINDDVKLEREADEIGKLILVHSKNPMRLSNTPRNLLEVAQDYEKMSTLDRLKTPPKDVIQKYEGEGDFDNPDSPAAADLEAFMDNLARSATRAIDQYDNDPYTTLIFTTKQLEDGCAAATTIEANLGEEEEDWHHVANICNPTGPNSDRGCELHPQTPIRITVAVDLNQHGTLDYQNGKVLVSLTHEGTAHLMHYKDWLRNLRSGAFTGEEIREAWRVSHGPEGLLNAKREHRKFARGDNHPFNQTAVNVYENIPRRQRRSYREELRRDMDAHVKRGRQPSYPI